MLSLLRHASRLSPPPRLARTTRLSHRKLSAMAANTDKPVVLYTAPTPNGWVPTILLEELKARRARFDASTSRY